MNEPSCTVGELIKYLEQFSKDISVVHRSHSDWWPLNLEDIELIKGIPKDSWIMHVYKEHISTMSEENKSNIQEFVAFPGN